MLQSSTGIRNEEDVKHLDMIQWNTDVTKACVEAANATYPTNSPNEPGIVVCYNLPLLLVEGNKASFAADFHVLKIASSIEKWASVDNDDYAFKIKYPAGGAAIQERELSPNEEAAAKDVIKDTGYSLVANLQYIGSIDPEALIEEADEFVPLSRMNTAL